MARPSSNKRRSPGASGAKRVRTTPRAGRGKARPPRVGSTIAKRSQPPRRQSSSARTATRAKRSPSSRRATPWWTQPTTVTSSLRYPRLAAAGFLLAVTAVTLATTFGILWLFVPDVALRTLEQCIQFGTRLVGLGQALVDTVARLL